MPVPPFPQSAASLWASDSPTARQTPSRPLEDSLLVTSHPCISLLHPPAGLAAWALQPVASTPTIRTQFAKHQPAGMHSRMIPHTGTLTPATSHSPCHTACNTRAVAKAHGVRRFQILWSEYPVEPGTVLLEIAYCVWLALLNL